MLDLLLIIVIAYCIFNGWRRGLIASIFSSGAYILSIIIARIISPILVKFLTLNTGIGNWVNGVLGDMISFSAEYEVASDMIVGFGAQKIIALISFGIIFTISSIILRRVAVMLRVINRIPIVGDLNKLGGMIAGMINAFILIFFVLSITYFLVEVTDNDDLGEKISNTVLVDIFYENNPLVSFTKGMLEP